MEQIAAEEIFEGMILALPSLHILLWGLFFIILFYTIIHVVIFVYHWQKYNIAPGPFLRRTYIVYFSGIFVFILGLLLSTVMILT